MKLRSKEEIAAMTPEQLKVELEYLSIYLEFLRDQVETLNRINEAFLAKLNEAYVELTELRKSALDK